MIVEGLLNAVSFLLTHFFSLFDFPHIPQTVHNVLHDTQFITAMGAGVSVVAGYTDFTFLLALFVFFIAHPL